MIKYLKFKIKRNKKKVFILFLTSLIVLSFLFFISMKFSINSYLQTYNAEPKIKSNVNYPLKGELYLKSSLGDKTFSEPIIYSLNKAKKSIEIAVYSIDILEIISILEEKRKSGLEITVIVPENKYEKNKEIFKDTGIKLISLGKKIENEEYGEFMHHKYVLIDYGTPDAKLFFGSTNLTSLQEKYDLSFLFETTDVNFIEPFKQEAELLKNKHTGMKKFFEKTYSPFSSKINYSNGFVEIWFGPGYRENSIKRRILELIDGAEKKIEIIAWRFNDEDIYKALIKKSKDGLEIKIIGEDLYFWSEFSKIKELLFLSNNLNKKIEVISDSFNNVVMTNKFVDEDPEITGDFNSFMHYHTMIVDDKIVVTGTNNWGLNGFFRNDESSMITDVEWMVKSFDENFDLLFHQLKGDNLNYEIKYSDSNNKKIYLKEDYQEDSKYIIYKEKSYPNIIGEVCSQGQLNTSEILVPNVCLGDQTKIFIFDKYFSLISSAYIK